MPEQPHTDSADTAVADAASSVLKYRQTDEKLFMTLAESVHLCEALADEVRDSGYEIDAIVGIANGALLPTRVIADALGMPCEFVRYRRQGSTIKRRLGKIPGLRQFVTWIYGFRSIAKRLAPVIDKFNTLDTDASSDAETPADLPGSGRVLLVDDAIDSGQSIQIAREKLYQRGASEVRTVVITWSDKHDSAGKYDVVPEYFLNRRVQHYPWSENNSELKLYQGWLASNDLQEWD